MKKSKFRTMIVLSNVLAITVLMIILVSNNLRYLPLFLIMMISIYFIWYIKMPILSARIKSDTIAPRKD